MGRRASSLSARRGASGQRSAGRRASAEARREAFEALAPQKSARQGLVTLGAFWDRARLLAGAGRSCRAQAAGEVLAEGRRLLHSHLRRVRAVHSLQKSGFSCSGGASMSMSINRSQSYWAAHGRAEKRRRGIRRGTARPASAGGEATQATGSRATAGSAPGAASSGVLRGTGWFL